MLRQIHVYATCVPPFPFCTSKNCHVLHPHMSADVWLRNSRSKTHMNRFLGMGRKFQDKGQLGSSFIFPIYPNACMFNSNKIDSSHSLGSTRIYCNLPLGLLGEFNFWERSIANFSFSTAQRRSLSSLSPSSHTSSAYQNP